MAAKRTLNIGNRRELFIDDLLIEKMKRTNMRLHEPQPCEVSIIHDKPWEGKAALYHTIIQDGDRVLLFYRGWVNPNDQASAVYCLAESDDGIHFKRPRLDLHPFGRTKKTNIVLADAPGTHNLAPFLDSNPNAKESERFKALASGPRPTKRTKHNLVAYGSPDGIHWKLLRKKPVIVNPTPFLAFDSQNVSFWSESENCYVTYYRTWSERPAMAPTSRNAAKRIRRVSRSTSDDFRNWSPHVEMRYETWGEPSPMEEFYISQTHPYFRAPHIYVAMPTRFMKARRAVTEEEARAIKVGESQKNDCSDACFMTSRPGNDYYDRTRMEGWHRPPVGPQYWTARVNYPANGVIQTGPDEMSVYIDDRYMQPGNRLRRYSLRLDGFMSVNAPYGGGEMRTHPFKFTGDELELNYETSAAGEMRVEIQNAAGKPIPGYSLRDAVDVFGNKIAGRARWKHGASVSKLAGKPVRLRFVMRDADLFSLRFVKAGK